MASKKLKKALIAGIAGAVGAKMLGQRKEMAQYLKTEGGDKAKIPFITKKPTFKQKLKKAVTTYMDKGIRTGRGPGIKKTDTLAGMGKDTFGLGAYDGAKAGKMIKARGGKLVNTKQTKLY